MSDVESDGVGGVVYRTPIWRTEEADKLIRRCDTLINNGGRQGHTKILSQKMNTLISSVIAKSSCSSEISFSLSRHYSLSYR